MFYSILAQVKHNLKTRKCKAVFAVILGFVLANYLQNVFRYAGYDVIDMYHPMKLRLLVATDNPLGFYFMQLFHFLRLSQHHLCSWKIERRGMRYIFALELENKDTISVPQSQQH